MSGPPDDAWLIALGTDVSDGKSVDWDQVDRRASDEQARLLVSNLKRLEGVIQAHRAAETQEDEATSPSAESATRHWHHLVLFETVGAGAFGTVYRAWDTKVDREVALKLLSESGSTARAPLSEARNLARIRHPNIVTVYGAEQVEGRVGIWMEFIQGETLADMIRIRGPMSAREAVGVGVDLCRALSALQAASLLHRDIKAHNVMREVGGRIVLMDFSGAWTSDAGETPANQSGTPLYMAPELFEDRPPTVASDIYSLGVLLFYLLSGRRPVEGESLADLRDAHLRRTRTRLRDLRPELPEAVVQVVERATAYDAQDRYQTAGELEHALVGTLGAYASPPSTPEPNGQLRPAAGSHRRLTRWVSWAVAAVAVLTLTAFVPKGWMRSAANDGALLVRFEIGPPDNTGSWPRISPDGRQIVFGTAVGGQDVLWVRPLDSSIGRPIPNTSARESPFWSPDGRFLAFFEKGKLKKADLAGSDPPLTLADALNPKGGDWNHDNVLLFATDTGLCRVGADGSGFAAVTTLDTERGEYSHGWPEFLPDGRHFLFVVRSTRPEHTGLYRASLDSTVRTRIMADYSRTVYSPAGYVLFARDGSLMAQRFDAEAGELRGAPEPLASRLKYHTGGDGAFDVSDTGVLIYRQSEGLPTTRLMLVDRTGAEIKAVAPIGAYRHPRFSPDGQRIVVESLDPETANADLLLFDLNRLMSSRITKNAVPDVAPSWSPDGREIAFSSKRGTRYEIYTKLVDEGTPEKLRPGPEGDQIVESWLPDSSSVVATVIRSGLWLVPLESGRQPSLIRATSSFDRWLAEVSPDGKWIAYTSFEFGEPEVFVEPVGRSGAQWQVSAHGGAEPHWRGDSRELFYLTLDGHVASVDVTPVGATWQARKARVLFRVSVPEAAGTSDYHVTADGRRFVVNTILGYPRVPSVQVAVHWTNLLGR